MDIHIAKTILNKRREKGLTQDELATYIGVSKASVSKWETGQSYPDIALLPKLATYFGISIDDLMGYTPQLTKGEIRKLYHRFATAFSKRPFADVMEEVREAVKEYYACHPLLLQMATLLLNHFFLAAEASVQTAVLEEAVALCERVKAGSEDLLLAQQAASTQAMLLFALGRPEEVIHLLQSAAALHPYRQDEQLLALAYKSTGNAAAAQKTLQAKSYQDVLSLIGACMELLPLYKGEPAHFEETLRRGEAVADAFHLPTLHPNADIQFACTAATCLTEMGQCERALHYLNRCLDSYQNFKFPLMLQGDDYFDLLGGFFEEMELGAAALTDEKLVRQNVLAMFSSPVFAPLFELPAYKALVARAKTLIGGN